MTAQRKVKHLRRDKHTEVWKPNVIGLKYRIKYEGEQSVAKGEHASPLMHWRRGHFRRQGSGTRQNDCAACSCSRKMHANVDHSGFCQNADCDCVRYRAPKDKYDTYNTIWIEPILVGSKVKTKEKEKAA